MINRVKEKLDNNFTMLPNEVFTGNLSPKAIGVFAYLLSRPDNWNFSIDEIKNHFSCGITMVRTSVQELEEKKLLLRVNEYNTEGKITKVDYILYPNEEDFKIKGIRKPYIRKPYIRKPNIRKSNTNNIDSNNIDSNNKKINNNTLSKSDDLDFPLDKTKDNSCNDKQDIDNNEFCQKVFDRYNTIAKKKNLKVHRKLTQEMKRKILARRKTYRSWEEWSDMFKCLRNSKYFGNVDRSEYSWFDLNFIVRGDTNFEKVCDGWMDWKAPKDAMTDAERRDKGTYQHGKEWREQKREEAKKRGHILSV